MKKVSLDILQKKYRDDYLALYRDIKEQEAQGKMMPVKKSGTNGKNPPLFQRYWVWDQEQDNTELKEELRYQLVPAISNDYYLKHLSVYVKDRCFVLMLNEYLKHRQDSLANLESMNERSFEIWKREKFLSREQGSRILKCCGISLESLNFYETSEPLAYYAHTREVPQHMVVVENKDTFYSMRRHLLLGGKRMFDIAVGTVIYGAGKGILRSFQDFSLCAEPYMREAGNTILYFGDLDFEGIRIYESLAELFWNTHEIKPFVTAYKKMLWKAGCGEGNCNTVKSISLLPETKEGQNRKLGTRFFSYFTDKEVLDMQRILQENRYIPQEILNISDF